MNVEVISRDIVKPSSPTPRHLHMHQFSFCDQIAASVFMPMIFFYPAFSDAKQDIIDRSNQLKESLSDALMRFYPLAGRTRDNLYIDCNDEGVPSVEAQVQCRLSEVVKQPEPAELNKLLPCD